MSSPRPASPPTTPAAPRLEFIDGLRGLAVSMVLLFHSYAFSGPWQVTVPLGAGRAFNIASLLSIGSTGVSLFLVLSGFCLYWPFATARRTEPSLREFLVRRCRRLLPPYYVALFVFAVLEAVQRVHKPVGDAPPLAASIPLHLVLLHNVRPEYFYDINGSFWSLALEFHLYLLFPLLVEAFRRAPGPLGKAAVPIGAFAFTVVFRWVALRISGGNNEWAGILTYSVFGRFFEFTLGMYAAWRVAESYRPGAHVPLVPRTHLVGGALLLLLCLAGAAVRQAEVFKASITGLVYAGLLLAASRPGAILHRLFSVKPLVSVGVISYSVYLIHHPLVMSLGGWARSADLPNTMNIVLQLGLVMPLVLAIGAVYFRLFERPFLNPNAGARRTPVSPASPALPVASVGAPLSVTFSAGTAGASSTPGREGAPL